MNYEFTASDFRRLPEYFNHANITKGTKRVHAVQGFDGNRYYINLYYYDSKIFPNGNAVEAASHCSTLKGAIRKIAAFLNA